MRHPLLDARPTVELMLGMALAAILALLNVAINLADRLRVFFAAYSKLPVVDWLIGGLFFWLAVVLWLAFFRWCRASARHRELESVVSSISPDVLVVTDSADRIVLANRSLYRLFGYTPDQIRGEPVQVLYEQWRLDGSAGANVRESLVRDGFYLGVATGKRKDDSRFPVEIIGAQLHGDEGRVLVLRDTTERYREQEKRFELEARVEQWRKLDSLSVLAGGIAHDFKNLLAAMSSHAELAAGSLPPESTMRHGLEGIVQAASRAARLCDQMLTFSGEGAMQAEPLDLNDTVRQAAQVLETPVPGHVALHYRLTDNLPAAQGDARQIQQVVKNFLANALEAMPPEGGPVMVRTGLADCSQDELSATYVDDELPAGRYVYFEIEDRGCGMDEKTIEKMFDPFFTTKFTGRGLELAYALGVIRSHRGAVDVQSELGIGTRVRVYFPNHVRRESEA